VPMVERRGMDVAASRSAGFPLSEVGAPRPHASDHAAVWIDLPEAIFPDGAGARPPGHCE
jgi:hypothetical protein